MGKIALLWFLPMFLPTSSCALVNKSDETFQEFLRQAMDAYPNWLSEHNLNPFPALQNILVMESENIAVFIHCNFTNAIFKDNSSSTNQTLESWSDFARHEFGVRRFLTEPFWLSVDFSCTGRLTEPEEDKFAYSGQGTYSHHAETIIEVVTVRHVGVTQDYKLDLELAESKYENHLKVVGNLIEGAIWNDSRIDKIIPEILKEFQNTFTPSLQSVWDQGDKQPLQLFIMTKYIMDKTKDVDLKSIMDENELPTPYSPSKETATINPTDSPSSEDITTPTQAGVNTATRWATKPLCMDVRTIVTLMMLVILLI